MSDSHTTSALQALANSIRKARTNANLKQAAAAKLLGFTRSTLSHYENGNTKDITADTLLNMSRAYNCSVVSFFETSPLQAPA